MTLNKYRPPVLTEAKRRHCLGLNCDRVFLSTHSAHRLCASCRAKNEKLNLPKILTWHPEVIVECRYRE